MSTPNKQIEIRTFTPQIELRADGDAQNIKGYAAVFNSDSVEFKTFFGDFVEQIRPGAFARTLKQNPDVRALVDHDTGRVIARTKNNTLKLTEDERGLMAEIQPNDTQDGRDIVARVKRGDIDGMSFGFQVVTDKWSMRDGKEFREILDVDLYEVSLVAFPAYPSTSAQVRSMADVFRDYQIAQRTAARVEKHMAKRRLFLARSK